MVGFCKTGRICDVIMPQHILHLRAVHQLESEFVTLHSDKQGNVGIIAISSKPYQFGQFFVQCPDCPHL